jgi:hypothetical protein
VAALFIAAKAALKKQQSVMTITALHIGSIYFNGPDANNDYPSQNSSPQPARVCRSGGLPFLPIASRPQPAQLFFGS